MISEYYQRSLNDLAALIPRTVGFHLVNKTLDAVEIGLVDDLDDMKSLVKEPEDIKVRRQGLNEK